MAERMQAVDLLVLSNGTGEITTWVRPVVQACREKLGNDRASVRISVVISPCANGTGKEQDIALSYPEVDRVQGAEHFWQFLLLGKTVDNWDWRDRGVVIFLGGDQFFCVVIGKRLGYRTVVYAEWEARWYQWIDRFGVMKPDVASVPPKYAHKLSVVGDLMVEAGGGEGERGRGGEGEREVELVGLLPGSKSAKLAQGVPLALAIAECIQAVRPQTRFVIPVAPTLDLARLASFADPKHNPVISLVGGKTARLVIPAAPKLPFLQTDAGLCVELWTRWPAYDLLSQCCLCITTIGANTAELGALAIPMIVLLPTQQLDAMRTWDGLPGILARLPGLGTPFAKAINLLALPRIGLRAWPNIWAQAEVVPELLGKLQPQDVAELALDWLNHPEKLQQISDRLRELRGQPGAAQKLAELISEEIRF